VDKKTGFLLEVIECGKMNNPFQNLKKVIIRIIYNFIKKPLVNLY